MAWASPSKVSLGCLAFAVFWLMALFPSVPFLPVGRTTGALLGAVLMVVFQVLTPDEAFSAIDLPILALLFGTMVVGAFLERADLFKYLSMLLSWRSNGPRDLLCRVCLLSATTSALLTNDTTCVVLTPFLLHLCRLQHLPPQPFLVALATSSNIGSAATPIGNPQNLVIALQGGVGFGRFLAGIAPAVAVGIVINTLGLLALYWRRLAPLPSHSPEGNLNLHEMRLEDPAIHAELEAGDRAAAGPGQTVPVGSQVMRSSCHSSGERELELEARRVQLLHTHVEGSRLSENTMTGTAGSESPSDALPSQRPGCEDGRQASARSPNEPGQSDQSGHLVEAMEMPASNSSLPVGPSFGSENVIQESNTPSQRWIQVAKKVAIYAATASMVGCLLAGLNLPWTAMTTAVALLCLDYRDGAEMLNKVSYSLLVFFSGMFISVQGFNRTGAPGQFWSAIEPHARLNSLGGSALLATAVTVLSNVASNVPTVLLLGPRLAQSTASTPGVSVTKAWLFLSWTSTVAGNLTIVGSAANLIVSEQARRAAEKDERYSLSFWNHLRYGVPSTILVMAAGAPLVR